jgi:hypothetical protein
MARPVTALDSTDIQRTAEVSDDGAYRYSLGRAWDTTLPNATFVLLNPAGIDPDADTVYDDAETQKCMSFAQNWHCGSITLVYIYGLRAVTADDLFSAQDPIGPENDAFLSAAAAQAAADATFLVGGWGSLVTPDRLAQVLAMPGMDRVTDLACTPDGQPRDPLQLRTNLKPKVWTPPA